MNDENRTNTRKTPMLEINPALAGVKPPAEVIELVNACVELFGYERSEIKNAFSRALSLPALDAYVNIDKRCRIAIDLVIIRLENRFPDRDTIEYGWKSVSTGLAGLEAVDKYGHGLFADMLKLEPVLSTTENADLAQVVKFLRQISRKMDTLIELQARK